MTSYISLEIRQQVRQDAGRRCGYCQSSEALLATSLEFDHIIPESEGGETIRENLWLACHACNKQKGSQTHAQDTETNEIVPLFNPRTQNWKEHFRWSKNGILIEEVTPSGRATIEALKMNNQFLVESRSFWVLAGWHPPRE